MKRRYASFLIRWWQHGTGRERLTVSHIQSGEQTTPESLSDAFAWIVDRAAEAGDGGEPDAATLLDGPPPRPDEGEERGDGDPPSSGSS